MKQTIQGFIQFVREQGVVGLAVGFILGGAISKVVASFVSDILNPVLGVIFGATGEFKTAYLQVGSVKILWGSFIATAIDFLVIALVVYYGVRVLKLDKVDKKKE